MEHVWTTASILCLIAAAILLLRDNQDIAFVFGTLGVVAWFLSYRVKLRATIIDSPETTDDEEYASEDQDEK